VTAGLVTTYDITFPGLAAFNCCVDQHGSSNNDMWFTDGTDNAAEILTLEFTNPHTPASLVGFDGGSITGLRVVTVLFAAPSSLALLGAGLLPVISVIRRRYLNR
jgi:hypothetical protein